jgi:hypothetical protein
VSQFSIYEVDFQIVKANAGGAGPTFAYRRPARRAVISAASAHPKDILATLSGDVSVGSGETIEVLSVRSAVVPGTEGASVLS